MNTPKPIVKQRLILFLEGKLPAWKAKYFPKTPAENLFHLSDLSELWKPNYKGEFITGTHYQ